MLTAKEILEEFDFNGDLENATIEQIREFRDSTWIGRKTAASDPDIINQATGRVTGATLTAAKRGAKSLGIEIDNEEIKGKKIEETIDFINEKIAAKIAALEEASKSGNDKKVTEALAKLEAYEKKLKEESELRENLSNELNEVKKSKESEIKNYKISDKYSKVRSAIPFSETANEFTIKGFENHIKENYQFELDEQENIIALDKQGSRIKNDRGTDFESLENILKREADKAGILKKNNANTQNPPVIRTLPQQTQGNNNTNEGMANKKALAHAESLRQA